MLPIVTSGEKSQPVGTEFLFLFPDEISGHPDKEDKVPKMI